MREVPLSKPAGFVALVDDEDFDAVMLWPWCGWKPKGGRVWYAVPRTVRVGRPVPRYMHQFIIGKAPQGLVTDHINGNGLDNRRCNLRWVTCAQNCWNEHSSRGGLSRYKGVTRNRQSARHPWTAYIRAAGAVRYIGSYETEVDAALAYDQAARAIRGKFACVNFPDVIVPPIPGVQRLLLFMKKVAE